LINELIGRDSETLYSGRPDIMIEEYEDNRLTKLWIGEVKYTDLDQTFSRGLKELVEYLYLVQNQDGDYLTDTSHETDIRGVLIVDDMEYMNADRVENNRVENSDSFELEVYDTESLKKI